MPKSNLIHKYNDLVSAGKISDDDAQREVLALLQEVRAGFSNTKKQLSSLLKPKIAPQSLYIYGEVGRGKSMLMDLFFSSIHIEKKRRVHFHAFMQEVHARIHEIRKKGLGDPVAMLAREISREVSLLCFDELQATDVADASLLFRLFDGLFAGGVCIISTSNRPPENLYTGGVQAERFEAFISLIREKMKVISLDADKDYRYLQANNKKLKKHFFPLGQGADDFLRDTLEKLGASEEKTEKLIVQGRELMVRTHSAPPPLAGEGWGGGYMVCGGYAATNSPAAFTPPPNPLPQGEGEFIKIAFFSFQELCENALGAADYLAIARKFTIVILANVPALTPEKRNEAKRFVTLIDALYEHKTQFFYTSETAPDGIYAHGDGAFEFKRTVSRLVEMEGW